LSITLPQIVESGALGNLAHEAVVHAELVLRDPEGKLLLFSSTMRAGARYAAPLQMLAAVIDFNAYRASQNANAGLRTFKSTWIGLRIHLPGNVRRTMSFCARETSPQSKLTSCTKLLFS
jgi:hypothetical protein